MGWTIYHDRVRDPVAEVRNLCTWTNEKAGVQAEPLDIARVGNVVYVAERITKQGRAPFVVAFVYLIQTSPTFGYKDMEESMGPVECKCPQRLMRLLTPVEELESPGYTAQWRANVAAYHAEQAKRGRCRAAIKPGTTIRFAEPIKFTSGVSASEFVARTIRSRGRERKVFEAVPAGFLCRIRASVLATATIA